MKHHYISLGSACDTAMILDALGLRNQSLPFDWLWNLDTGLSAITKIIQNDFQDINNPDCYIKTSHYRFNEDVTAYRDFPTIVHLHTDPLSSKGEHNTLAKRIVRLEELLKSDEHINFVYYRSHEEDKIKNKHVSATDSFNRMQNEIHDFQEILFNKFPQRKNRTKLLAILQSNPDEKHLIASAVKDSAKKTPDYIAFGWTIPRNDSEADMKKRWKQQWQDNIITKTEMPFLKKISLTIKSRYRRD